MTPEQFEKGKDLQKLINNHKGIIGILNGSLELGAKQLEIKLNGVGYTVSERLIHEFIHAAQHSLNKLEIEFNEI